MELKIKKNLKIFNPESYVKENLNNNDSNDNLIVSDCSLGVNPFGHSKNVDNVLIYATNNCCLVDYPSFPYEGLKSKIIDYWREFKTLDLKNIRFGGGSIDILRNINRIFIEKGTKVLGSGPTFTSFPSDVELNEGIFDYVMLCENDNFRFDVDKFLSRINPEYTLIYIDNPNNPTGQIIPLKYIRRIVEKAQKYNICVLVDEAYGDFMSQRNSAINLIDTYENVIVSRTFSKGFGIAGLRIGYAVAGEYLSEIIRKVDIPFTINTIGFHAAISALDDRDFIQESRKKIRKIKEELLSSFKYINVLETDMEVPIMTLQVGNSNLNLHQLFKSNGILTEAGEDFHGLGKSYVRLRVPEDYIKISSIINNIEKFIAKLK